MFTDPTGQEHVVANGWAAGMAVSPRGDLIAYETYAANGATIHVSRTDGSGEVAAIHAASSAAWSPDGRRLAFVSGRRPWHGAVAVAAADGRRIRRIVPGTTLRAPAWSPDGRRIAYARGYAALEAVAPNGHGRRRLALEQPKREPRLVRCAAGLARQIAPQLPITRPGISLRTVLHRGPPAGRKCRDRTSGRSGHVVARA